MLFFSLHLKDFSGHFNCMLSTISQSLSLCVNHVVIRCSIFAFIVVHLSQDEGGRRREFRFGSTFDWQKWPPRRIPASLSSEYVCWSLGRRCLLVNEQWLKLLVHFSDSGCWMKEVRLGLMCNGKMTDSVSSLVLRMETYVVQLWCVIVGYFVG